MDAPGLVPSTMTVPRFMPRMCSRGVYDDTAGIPRARCAGGRHVGVIVFVIVAGRNEDPVAGVRRRSTAAWIDVYCPALPWYVPTSSTAGPLDDEHAVSADPHKVAAPRATDTRARGAIGSWRPTFIVSWDPEPAILCQRLGTDRRREAPAAVRADTPIHANGTELATKPEDWDGKGPVGRPSLPKRENRRSSGISDQRGTGRRAHGSAVRGVIPRTKRPTSRIPPNMVSPYRSW